MRLYRRILLNTFKTKISFRFDYFLSTLFSFFYIVLRIFIWQGLYKQEDISSTGIFLNDMIAYSIISSLTQGITKSTVMTEINKMVLDGNISNQLLLPLNFHVHLFLSELANNVFGTLYNTIPPFLMGILIFGIHFDFVFRNLLLYCAAMILGFGINFLYQLGLGLTVIWLRNSFFLKNLDSLLTKLFSGSMVPLWFFPSWLNSISVWLPFRLIIFEPIAILLNKKTLEEIGMIFLCQVAWLAALMIINIIIWHCGKRKLMIQGG